MLPKKFLDFYMMHLYCSFGSVFNFMSTVDTVWLGVGRKRLCFCSKHLLLLPDLHSWRCSDTPSSVATNWAWDSPKSHQKYPKFVGQNRAEKYCGISSKTSSGLTLTKVVQDILEQWSLAKQPSNLAVTSRLKLVNDQGRTLFISSFSSLGNSSNWGNGMSNKESTTMLAAMWWCTQALLCFEPTCWTPLVFWFAHVTHLGDAIWYTIACLMRVHWHTIVKQHQNTVFIRSTTCFRVSHLSLLLLRLVVLCLLLLRLLFNGCYDVGPEWLK